MRTTSLISLFLIIILCSCSHQTTKYRNIFEAVLGGDLSAVKLLAGRDPASINEINPAPKNHNQPLHVAIEARQVKIAIWLATHGAMINQKDSFGESPLSLAVQYNLPDVAKVLIEKGADVNSRGAGDTSILQKCCIGEEKEELAKLLVGKSADLNAQDSGGATPLISAAAWNCKNILSLLLNHGADMNIQDKQGKTALDYAILKRNKDIVTILEEKGAKSGEQPKGSSGKK